MTFLKTWLSLLKVNTTRAIFSVRFLLSGGCIVFVLLSISFGMINSDSDVLSVVLISGSGHIPLIVGVLPLIPFAVTFASEWQERAVNFWIIRTGVRLYATSKVIVSACSAFFATFIGIMLHALILWSWLPLYTSFQTGDAYAPLLEAGMPWQYLVSSAAHLSLSSSLFSVTALWISTYIPNKWTALAAPIVLYFVLLRLTRNWDTPSFLKVGMLIEGTYHAGSPIAAFLFKLGIVFVLCWLMGIGTMIQIVRRVRHD